MPIYKYDPYTFEIECNDFESMSKDRARNLVYGGKLWTNKNLEFKYEKKNAKIKDQIYYEK